VILAQYLLSCFQRPPVHRFGLFMPALMPQPPPLSYAAIRTSSAFQSGEHRPSQCHIQSTF
jgi:hypothetical protein